MSRIFPVGPAVPLIDCGAESLSKCFNYLFRYYFLLYPDSLALYFFLPAGLLTSSKIALVLILCGLAYESVGSWLVLVSHCQGYTFSLPLVCPVQLNYMGPHKQIVLTLGTLGGVDLVWAHMSRDWWMGIVSKNSKNGITCTIFRDWIMKILLPLESRELTK